MLKLHWLASGLSGISPGLCTKLPGVRKHLETVTISFLALLLSSNQGKQFPRSKLQGTTFPNRAGLGLGVYIGGSFPKPCTRSRELRKRPGMVTIVTLDLLLPATRGKHFPRSQLQDTTSPGRPSTGSGPISGISNIYLPGSFFLTAPGPPVKLPTVS